jgi:putative transposase
VDFLFTARRDRAAAGRFLERAIGQHGEPEKITIDKSGANAVAIDSDNAEHEAGIEMRQCKYLTDVFDKTFLAGGVIFSLHV